MNTPVDLQPILAQEEGPGRTAALAAWFQGLFPEGSAVPVLVGGAAVEVYSGGAYTTGDLDFVGEVPSAVAARLRAAGFVQQGRHWVHDEGQVFLEIPGAALDPAERAVTLQVDGWSLLALSPEDLLVDRLAAWQFWSSPLDGVAAVQLWQSVAAELDERHLTEAAARKGVAPALDRLRAFAVEVSGQEPTEEELIAWARNRNGL